MTKPKRIRSKSCDICGQSKDVLYRVQYGAIQTWQFVCRSCWEQVSQQSDYRYGGTWKAHKRH
ncbi:MAG: hypothetical protein AAF708_19335 [Deinococcota bacterium]